MCGRYSISKSPAEWGCLFGATVGDDIAGAVYNAAPTMMLPVIGMQEPGRVQYFSWGISKRWTTSAHVPTLLINARAESVFEKRTFKDWVFHNRCIVPADGFYEWTGNGKERQPWRFSLLDDGVFAFAGLFAPISATIDDDRMAFCIITTQANSLIAPFHDRMPVMLRKDQAITWLTASAKETLQPCLEVFPAEDLKVHKVSPKINKAGVNTPDLILPWQSPELTLF